MSQTNERVSLATYLSARYRLLQKCMSYRQWSRSEPTRAAHYLAYLRQTQRQLASLRRAERIPAPAAMPFPY